MVQFISTLSTTAAVLSLALSVSALPANPSETHLDNGASAPAPTANKRDGPFVVQARSVQQKKAKRGYVGGGSGKTLRQAPMMRPARMVKAKRGMQERSDHTHEHIHTHDHDHEHDGGDYDPSHSEHWNYHHNRIDHDGHGHHHHERDLINLEVLNIGSGNRKTVYSGHNNQVNTGHNNHVKNIKNHKRAISDLFPRSKKNSKSSSSKKSHDGESEKKENHPPSHPKVKVAIKKPSSAVTKKVGDKKHKEGKEKEKRHHNDHWDHDHDHEHIHEHDHDHTHDHAHIYARDHDRDHSDHWYEHHDLDRHHHDHDHSHDHAHVHIHEHDHRRRDLAASGVPGFVEVASTFFHSSLAKSVAGLVFSKDPNSNSSDFVLGTSDSQSTQFYLAPYTSSAASADAGQNSSDPSSTVSTYQLRIPVLDGTNLRTNDYCATFDINPPSPLSMHPCGDLDGHSQVFSYNSTTGELTPVYPATSSQPVPLNAAVRLGSPRVLAAQAGSPPDLPTSVLSSSTDAWASVASTDTLSLPSQLPASQTVSAPSAATSSAPVPAETPRVALYFVPSSGFYEEASTIDSLAKAGQSSFDDTSSTISAAVPSPTVFNPALVGGIKAVDYDGSYNGSDDDDTYYTTVTITTTISADEAGPTDGPVYGGSDGRNNAVIADSADGDDSYAYYSDSA